MALAKGLLQCLECFPPKEKNPSFISTETNYNDFEDADHDCKVKLVKNIKGIGNKAEIFTHVIENIVDPK